MPAADPAFVSLVRIVRGGWPDAAASVVAEAALAPAMVPAAPAPAPLAPECVAATAALLRDVRRFRARLAEAFAVAQTALVREFAYAVLGRELQLSAPDLAQIAARVLAEHPAANALALRIAPADRALLLAQASALPPLVDDSALAPGDVVLELACGHIDARLGVRLAAVLADDA